MDIKQVKDHSDECRWIGGDTSPWVVDRKSPVTWRDRNGQYRGMNVQYLRMCCIDRNKCNALALIRTDDLSFEVKETLEEQQRVLQARLDRILSGV